MYRNDIPVDGDAWDDTWGTSQSLYTFASGEGHDLEVADVDDDGDPDVIGLVAEDDDLFWFRNDGTPFSGTWNRYTIDSNTGDLSFDTDGRVRGSVEAGDIDNDGNDEVILGSCVLDEYGNGLWSTGFTTSSTPASTLSTPR